MATVAEKFRTKTENEVDVSTLTIEEKSKLNYT